jgi:hypothetical protein
MMAVTMHRTQVLLDSWLHDALKSVARQEGRSLAAVIRAILAEHLEQRRAQARKGLGKLAGLAEGPPDLGREHDAHLYGRSGEE